MHWNHLHNIWWETKWSCNSFCYGEDNTLFIDKLIRASNSFCYGEDITLFIDELIGVNHLVNNGFELPMLALCIACMISNLSTTSLEALEEKDMLKNKERWKEWVIVCVGLMDYGNLVMDNHQPSSLRIQFFPVFEFF